MPRQTFTYDQDDEKRISYLERLRAYTAMQLKKDTSVEKWLALQIEIEQIQYHIQFIEYRLKNRGETPYYKNNFDTKKTALI